MLDRRRQKTKEESGERTGRYVTAARLTRRITHPEAQALAKLEPLAQGWRDAFAKMAGGAQAEDTKPRLQGP